MRKQLAFAATTALAVMLTACGGSNDEGEERSAVDEVVTAEPAIDAAEDGEIDRTEIPENDSENDSENGDESGADAEREGEAGPEPVASVSATPRSTPTPQPTPSQVASMEPPSSFNSCSVCHSVKPGENRIGPTLAGVFSRKAGSVSGANYSPAMQSAEITWNEANLRRYIRDPHAVVPGGTMPNPGLDAAQTQAVVNYLKTL